MKKIIYIFVLVLFTLTSCDTKEISNDNENTFISEKDYLMVIYDKANNVFGKLQREPDNISIIKELDSVVYDSKLKLSKYHGYSDYKRYFSKVGNISQSDVDYYSENLTEFINLTQNNCTEVYADYIKTYFIENEITFNIDEVIINKSLLNNEKISLILLLSYSENQFDIENTSGMRQANQPACERAYSTAIGRCNRNTAVGVAFSGLAAVGSGGMAAAIAISYVWAQDMMCRNDASEDYFECIK